MPIPMPKRECIVRAKRQPVARKAEPVVRLLTEHLEMIIQAAKDGDVYEIAIRCGDAEKMLARIKKPNPAVRGRESASVPCTGVVLPPDSDNQNEEK